MKKIRNLTIGGIQQKIYNLVLTTIILIVAAYTIVLLYQANKISGTISEISRQWEKLITNPEQLEAEELTERFAQISREYTGTLTSHLDQA